MGTFSLDTISCPICNESPIELNLNTEMCQCYKCKHIFSLNNTMDNDTYKPSKIANIRNMYPPIIPYWLDKYSIAPDIT